MSRTVIDDGSQDGVVEEIIIDEAENKMHLSRQGDAQSVLDHNARLRTANDGYTPSRLMRRVASIPAEVQLAWLVKYGVEGDPLRKGNEVLLRRLLAGEYAYLRTSPGRF